MTDYRYTVKKGIVYTRSGVQTACKDNACFRFKHLSLFTGGYRIFSALHVLY